MANTTGFGEQAVISRNSVSFVHMDVITVEQNIFNEKRTPKLIE